MDTIRDAGAGAVDAVTELAATGAASDLTTQIVLGAALLIAAGAAILMLAKRGPRP